MTSPMKGISGLSFGCVLSSLGLPPGPTRHRITRQSLHLAGLVQRRFVAEGPNRLWVADIFYIRTRSGIVHVTLITDIFSRRIVG
jgi:transposase InsO family protein